MDPSTPLDDREFPDFARDPAATLEAQLARRRSPRRRVAQGAGLLLAVLTLVVILFRLAPQRNFGMTSTPSRPGGINSGRFAVMVNSNVTQGLLTVNGARYDFQPGRSVPVKQGENTFVLRAAPFAPVTCTLHYPDQVQEATQCPIENQDDATITIVIPVGPGALRSDGVAQAESAVDAAVHATSAALRTTASAGMHYGSGRLDAQGLPESAMFVHPTSVQLLVTPGPFDANCAAIPSVPIFSACPESFGALPSPVSGMFWQVNVPLILSWQFMDEVTNARTTIDLLGDMGSASATQYHVTMDLRFDGTRWAVAQSPLHPSASRLEAIGSAQCDYYIDPIARIAVNSGADVYWQGGTRVIEGCVYGVTVLTNSAMFLWRFGVILAVNTLAHQQAPSLPVATPAEVAAAGVPGI
jgi:hypothetical protein